jgi:hypothetical protein
MESGTETRSDAGLDRLVMREELRLFLREKLGFPLSAGTMNQLCSPARGEGPPIAGYWGRSPLYRLSEGVDWAQNRLRKRPYQLHPAPCSEPEGTHPPNGR